MNIHPTLIFSYIVSWFKSHFTISLSLLVAIASSLLTIFFVNKANKETYTKEMEKVIITTTQKVQTETEQRITEKYNTQIATLTAQYESKLHEITTTEEITTKKTNGEVVVIKKQKTDRNINTTSSIAKTDEKKSTELEVVKKDTKNIEQAKTEIKEKIVEKKVIERQSWSVHALITQDSLSFSSVQFQPRYGILIEKNFPILSVGVLGSFRPDNSNIGIGLSIGLEL